ncbi:hypothetical protein ANN_24512 [Periplaneta americana]|uniref:Cytochrome P450 n=1 Tax=Periplaneta americana TaxID=6978 RepID=A0ABQ8S3Y8_PERAM|nr:hypothetical protein ANN_24512 [Periplaneta americana]
MKEKLEEKERKRKLAAQKSSDLVRGLRKKVDNVLKKYGGELTFDGLQEMTYLDMAVNESLRLYPPGTVLLKKCSKPFRLETPSGGSFELEAGTPVAVPLFAIHRDP